MWPCKPRLVCKNLGLRGAPLGPGCTSRRGLSIFSFFFTRRIIPAFCYSAWFKFSPCCKQSVKPFGVEFKEKSIALLAGAWLVVDALASLAYSTDLILLFQVGRIVRLAVGLLLFAGSLPKGYAQAIGIYLALEAIGSTIVSPDDAILWQTGRIGRVFIGAWLYESYK